MSVQWPPACILIAGKNNICNVCKLYAVLNQNRYRVVQKWETILTYEYS